MLTILPLSTPKLRSNLLKLYVLSSSPTGPFWCAQDNLSIAHSSCMKHPDLISVTELVTITYNTAATATIDPLSYLNNDCVYLLAGTLDSVVNPGEHLS